MSNLDNDPTLADEPRVEPATVADECRTFVAMPADDAKVGPAVGPIVRSGVQR